MAFPVAIERMRGDADDFHIPAAILEADLRLKYYGRRQFKTFCILV